MNTLTFYLGDAAVLCTVVNADSSADVWRSIESGSIKAPKHYDKFELITSTEKAKLARPKTPSPKPYKYRKSRLKQVQR